MADYITLGSRQVTAAADQTGLNTGNMTNEFAAAELPDLAEYEIYKAVVTGAPIGASAEILIGTRPISFTAPGVGGGSEWDPSQPPVVKKGQEVYFLWNIVQGVSLVTAQNWGGGGGGSGNLTTDPGGGSGGGGGEYAKDQAAVTPGHTYAVTVGAAGTAGAAAGGAGGAGGNSIFSGDSLTITAHGGSGGIDSPATGGPGGTGSTNAVHFNGGAGAAGISSGTFSGGGGSSAGTAAAGNPGSVSAGGVAPAGGGNGGNGGPSGGAGLPGSAPGGAGGGGRNNVTNEPGGAGAAGQVILTWTGGTQTFASSGSWTAPAPAGTPVVTLWLRYNPALRGNEFGA